MAAYLLKRAVQAIPVLIGISLVAFVLIHLVPGDPVRIILGAQATPQAVATLNEQLGLDRSLPSQYIEFITGAVHLDFGESITQKTSVSSILKTRLDRRRPEPAADGPAISHPNIRGAGYFH